MQKVVRVMGLGQQDEMRRRDCAQMTPIERVEALVAMQSKYLRWDVNPRISRVGTIKVLDFKDVSLPNG